MRELNCIDHLTKFIFRSYIIHSFSKIASQSMCGMLVAIKMNIADCIQEQIVQQLMKYILLLTTLHKMVSNKFYLKKEQYNYIEDMDVLELVEINGNNQSNKMYFFCSFDRPL